MPLGFFEIMQIHGDHTAKKTTIYERELSVWNLTLSLSLSLSLFCLKSCLVCFLVALSSSLSFSCVCSSGKWEKIDGLFSLRWKIKQKREEESGKELQGSDPIHFRWFHQNYCANTKHIPTLSRGVLGWFLCIWVCLICLKSITTVPFLNCCDHFYVGSS